MELLLGIVTAFFALEAARGALRVRALAREVDAHGELLLAIARKVGVDAAEVKRIAPDVESSNRASGAS